MTLPSIDVLKRGHTPEAIRARARLILDMALDRVEEGLQAEELPLKDATAVVGALGRIAGVQSTEVNLSGSVGHLHLEAMLAARPTIDAHKASAMLPHMQEVSPKEDTITPDMP